MRQLFLFIQEILAKKAIRLSTLDAICKVLGCQPGDIPEYKRNERYSKIIR
ncbi:MAG TPA: helix-turn-helix domain-containing protein [Thermoanaerobacterales bacterium]|uniref:helix-turn-helix domain-containing protein n=1 Tax=Tepidanaerobacter sp. GT38 TaxID=2722793 RepID=UPI0017E09815|nr:helix-turn-helix domain-containing protein [Tepidanaerobacter sp. GT38]MCG1011673.1 helix-turn-helix domain-containing protein [Tepidanaerobacter sp. GT38]HHY41528.1 helix-turn-helix domain-containing protein [Thermoanaerobacterales bacterium]